MTNWHGDHEKGIGEAEDLGQAVANSVNAPARLVNDGYVEAGLARMNMSMLYNRV